MIKFKQTAFFYRPGNSCKLLLFVFIFLAFSRAWGQAPNLKPSVIRFPPPVTSTIGPDGILHTGATSNNTETPIVYTSSNPSVAYIGTDDSIHVVAPGITTITASQGATADYSAASVQQTYTIKETQTISFAAIIAKSICQVDFPAGATSSNAALPLTYSSSNTAVATISASGIIHITGVGTTTISVNQPGNNLFIAAPPQTQILTVVAPAAPLFAIINNASGVCTGAPVTFTAILSNAVPVVNPTYQWQLNGANVGTNNTYTAPVVSTDAIICTVTNNDVCPSSASVSVTNIVTIPFTALTVSIQVSPSGAVCGGTPVTFTATPNLAGANTVYQWKVNGVNAGNNNPVFSSSSFANGDIVTCSFTNNSIPCSVTATSNAVAVSIIAPSNPAPSVTISASANNVYAGSPITFTATPVNAVNNPAYQWQVNGANAGVNSSTFTTATLANGDIITCTMQTTGGCNAPVTSAPITATILPPVVVIPPNTFTPNGDGINDVWSIPALTAYPNCLVTIYTRYGSEIFRSKGYNNPWDGLYKGSKLPVGAYYYVIDLGNNKLPVSGYVAIIR